MVNKVIYVGLTQFHLLGQPQKAPLLGAVGGIATHRCKRCTPTGGTVLIPTQKHLNYVCFKCSAVRFTPYLCVSSAAEAR